MNIKKSTRRLLMSEEAWAEYQKERIKRNSNAQTMRDRNSRKVMRYRRAMKARLIEYKGGMCQLCGYNKDFPNAYHFHHRNPEDKLFSISSRGCTLSFATLVKEVDKCDLLCANCHAELHDKQHADNTFLKEELKDRELRKPYQLIEKKCKKCDVDFTTKFPNQIYCTTTCRIRYRDAELYALKNNTPISLTEPSPNWRNQPRPSTRKANRPSQQELEDMLRTMSYCAVGRKYGVSDNAVRKWEKSYRNYHEEVHAGVTETPTPVKKIELTPEQTEALAQASVDAQKRADEWREATKMTPELWNFRVTPFKQ